MKYGKEFNKALEELPVQLRRQCVDYKQWKKKCQSGLDLGNALLTLRSQCDAVENTFQEEYGSWQESLRRNFLACFHRNKNTVHPETLLRFANTNAKTVYKICKRLQKLTQNKVPLDWLTSLRASHTYAFLGGMPTTYLHMKLDAQSVIECPICMEDQQLRQFLIYSCGHFACISCTLQYANVGHSYGKWYHLLNQSKKTDCPYCHYSGACRDAVNLA